MTTVCVANRYLASVRGDGEVIYSTMQCPLVRRLSSSFGEKRVNILENSTATGKKKVE